MEHRDADSERPALCRTRSHTDPSSRKASPLEPQGAGAAHGVQAQRPPHVRSKSYLHASETGSRALPTATSALERTAEKVARIHLPGSSHRHHHHHPHSHSHYHPQSQNVHSPVSATHARHRSAQGDVHHAASRYRESKEAISSLPHLVAGLNAEREKRTQVPRSSQYPFGPSGLRDSEFHDGGRYDSRVRAISDPKRPEIRPKTSFELALERGDRARVLRRINVKKDDIVRRDAEIMAADEEMRARVASIMSTGVEVTRRLDYGYYNLLETVGNLVATIKSFQTLAHQSEQLIINFERETHRLDKDTRSRVKSFRTGFDERDHKVTVLAERGRRVNAKAEDLSRRLENARVVVENWEKREDQVRKVWSRVFRMMWGTVVMVVVTVVCLVLVKEWWFRGDPVKAGLRAHGEGSWNRSLRLGGEHGTPGDKNEQLLLQRPDGNDGHARKPNVPDDVRDILLGIAERNRQRKVIFPEVPREIVGGCAEAEDCLSSRSSSLHLRQDEESEDPRLRQLDEL